MISPSSCECYACCVDGNYCTEVIGKEIGGRGCCCLAGDRLPRTPIVWRFRSATSRNVLSALEFGAMISSFLFRLFAFVFSFDLAIFMPSFSCINNVRAAWARVRYPPLRPRLATALMSLRHFVVLSHIRFYFPTLLFVFISPSQREI